MDGQALIIHVQQDHETRQQVRLTNDKALASDLSSEAFHRPSDLIDLTSTSLAR